MGYVMKSALIVVRPFETYAVGDVITDTNTAEELLAGEHAHDVVRVPYNQEVLSPVWNGSETGVPVREGEV